MKYLIVISLGLFSFVTFSQKSDYDQAVTYLDQQKIDQARASINSALSQNQSIDNLLLSALINERQALLVRAIADYETILKTDKHHLEANFGIGLIYFNQKNFKKSIIYFTRVLSSNVSAPTQSVFYSRQPSGEVKITTMQMMQGEIYQYRARAYQELGMYDKAQADFDLAESQPINADLYINRALLFKEMNRLKEAKKDLHLALSLDSLNPHAWYNLALIDETIVIPEHVQMVDHAPLFNLAGYEAYESQNYQLALQRYSHVIVMDPSNENALINRGRAYLQLGENDKARSDFFKSLTINPKNLDVLFLVGNSYFKSNQFKEALLFYEKFLEVSPSNGTVWYNCAMAHFNLDQDDQACECLNFAKKQGMQDTTNRFDSICRDKN